MPSDFASDDWINQVSAIIQQGQDPTSLILGSASGYAALDNIQLPTLSSDDGSASS